VAIICISIAGIGLISLKLGAAELWREHILQKGAANTTATVVHWQAVRGRYATTCSVSYRFTTRNGNIAFSHDDDQIGFFGRNGFTSFPCRGDYGSKTIPVLYSTTDPHVNRPLEQPAVTHGLLFCGIGIFLLVIAYQEMWHPVKRHKS
jgi:hypothetical protein